MADIGEDGEPEHVPYEIRAECLSRWIERNRAALMTVHADDWDMETISEAAHICAHAQALATFGVSTGPRHSGRSVDGRCRHRFPPNAPAEVIAWRCVACGEWINDGDTELERLRREWQTAVQRGRPDRYAKQKAYLAALARAADAEA